MNNEYDFSKENIAAAREGFKKEGTGRRGPFYNKTQEWIFNVSDDKLFENAVWQGYLDASRTFYKIKNTQTERKAFTNLAGHIQGYLAGKEAFDHSSWCKDFMDDIMKYNCYPSRYGQAQKVVNMAFKYLYCCDGAPKDKFSPCHMPLDTFVLLWFFSKSGVYYEGWSYFDEYTYTEVQNEIRGILKGIIILVHHKLNK